MWKLLGEKGEIKGSASDFKTLLMTIKEVDEQVKALKTRLSELEQNPSEKVTGRLDAIEVAMENLQGDWAVAKGHLQSLYGRITKREGLQAKEQQAQEPVFKDAEDVLDFARAKGLTR